MNAAAITSCQARQWRFQNALEEKNADEAIRQFALAFEESAATACIDKDGRPKTVPHDCWKKCRSKIKKLTPIAAPILKGGGSSDFTVPVCQPSISVSRHVKQLRRVQSLYRQLESFERSGVEAAGNKCQQLWIKICSANGFEHGFQYWILLQFGIFVPTALPTAEYVQSLYLQLQEFVKEEVTIERQARCSFQKMQLLEDIAGGVELSLDQLETQLHPRHPSSAFPGAKRYKNKDGRKKVTAESFTMVNAFWKLECQSCFKGSASCWRTLTTNSFLSIHR
jgi:hypothetical protein